MLGQRKRILDWDWAATEREYKLAIELDPRGPFAREAKQMLKDHGMERIQ